MKLQHQRQVSSPCGAAPVVCVLVTRAVLAAAVVAGPGNMAVTAAASAVTAAVATAVTCSGNARAVAPVAACGVMSVRRPARGLFARVDAWCVNVHAAA